ncbi:unnamed protein product [Parnassius apollo]|uniref:(apollo) hypothetical protein n=1 Tax=Parnassius apollo TaxID=110799 RepID=A0A8S3XH89_PARAO|nr:unnamed protein product [Parnassius apollo]
MAIRNIFLIGLREKCKKFGSGIYSNYASAPRFIENNKFKSNECKTEKNLNCLEDPDTFGTLSGKLKNQSNDIFDEGDLKEEKYLQNLPLPSQKLTIRQYADLIKQYLKHKRLKEALNVLEIRMLQEDRVKPENYIYNILIGACADVGYTKKAFRLYNDMKRRALTPTGDTYTCLFEACINSPWPADGLKNAKHLRDLMIEKGIEPNLTNYNVMIKAFGRCGDLKTAFKIVDEMISKKIKIRVHTFNHLLHACISDKENGLRYALLVWRKMLTMKEKPNIYSFNLMLKCVKDCNLGSKDDIQSLIMSIQDQTLLGSNKIKRLQIESRETKENTTNSEVDLEKLENFQTYGPLTYDTKSKANYNCISIKDVHKGVTVLENQNSNSITILPKEFQTQQNDQRTIPNLLSNVLQLNQVLSLQEVDTLQDKFAIIGGQDDFLREMEANAVKPDIKTFTQMLPLIEETREAENKIMETMKSLNIKPDIDFLNMVIKKRCIRMDYDGAFLIKEFIDNENKSCDKRFKRRKSLKPNIMTYGVLALACKTKENAEKILNEMKEKHLKVNIEILGALLRHGTVHRQFGYVLFIMDVVKQENLRPNEVFLKHLEAFHDKCVNNIKQHHQNENSDTSFTFACKNFLDKYKIWLKDVRVTEIETEHPWKQFMEPQPETIQRQHFEIKEPKKFYKINRKYIRYTPKI